MPVQLVKGCNMSWY